VIIDLNFRTALANALDKSAGDPITETELAGRNEVLTDSLNNSRTTSLCAVPFWNQGDCTFQEIGLQAGLEQGPTGQGCEHISAASGRRSQANSS